MAFHRVLITAGPTREPIDPVRYIGNRSSGRMGAALAEAAINAGHHVTIILGPVHVSMPPSARRIDVETASQMHSAVMQEFPGHDLLIMAAAVADYRPIRIAQSKLPRGGTLSIECEPTPDIVAAAAKMRRPDQRIIGFSLEASGDLDRAREKLIRKDLDLIVFNPIQTMNSAQIEPALLWRDGRKELISLQSKEQFAKMLLAHAYAMFP
jgi:phosphopantothenoylcysteine decarboxylase/phosphopantothenate--cysteine ligase